MPGAPIASVSLAKAAPFLVQAALLLALIVWLHVAVVERALAGRFSMWSPGLLVVDVLFLRGMFGQALVLLRGLSSDHRALWIEDGRLIYLSPLYSWVSVDDISSIELTQARRGFGLQPYAIITTHGGRRLHVHTAILHERFEHLRDSLLTIAAPA